MSKKTIISDDNRRAFEEAVRGVKKLHHTKIRLKKIDTPVKRQPAQVDKDEIILDEKRDLPFVRGEQTISYKHESLPHKTLRKLKKGQYNIDAVLDLHGMTVDDARAAVSKFLDECLEHDMHIVLIVHGKGHHSSSPILKNKLNNWLRGLDFILAFCSANTSHGNRGAVYVLLKKNTEENRRG